MLNGAWNTRPAAIDDARTMAEVQVESYESAYRGILPDALLNGLSVEKRECAWRELLAAHEPPSAITIVGCEAGGSVVGFASGGKERTGELGCDGEICAIYLRPEAQTKGAGSHDCPTIRARVGDARIWFHGRVGFRSQLLQEILRMPRGKVVGHHRSSLKSHMAGRV